MFDIQYEKCCFIQIRRYLMRKETMLVPLFIFYELGIVIAWAFGKKRPDAGEPEDETFE